MKKAIISAVGLIYIALLSVPQIAYAAVTTIEICNSGNTELSIARLTDAGNSNGHFELRGWYKVKPGGFFSSCIYLNRRGFDGYYYFVFKIKGKNGTGLITPRVRCDAGQKWICNNSFVNTKRKFCIGIHHTKLTGTGPRSMFEDLDKCPSGWVLARFPIGLRAWGGTNYKLTVDADSSLEVEL